MRHITKKSMAAVLFAVMLLCQLSTGFSAFAETPQIVVGNAYGCAGEIVDVEVSMSYNPGVVSVLLEVDYDDTKLELVGVSDAGKLGGAYHSDNYTSPYTLSWANDTATSNYTSDGTIVTLKFRIASTVSAGQSIPVFVHYDYGNYDIIDKDLNKVIFATVSGDVYIKDKHVDLTGVGVNPSSKTMIIGESTTFNAYFYPSDATDKRVSWSSSDPNIATVDASGKVTAVAAGYTYITVTTVSGGYQASCYLKVLTSENPECYGMYISSTPYKVYKVGESFDPDGMKLCIDDDGRGYYDTYVTEGFTVSGFDSSTPGKRTLTVHYKGYTDTYEIEVIELLSIEIGDTPDKTRYYVDDEFVSYGLYIYANYTGDHKYHVSKGFTLSGFDSSTAGTKKITVEYNGKKTSFTVEVNEKPYIYVKEEVIGDELVVSLHLQNAKGIGAGDLALYYDDKIFTLMTLENSTIGKLVENPNEPGEYYVKGTAYRVVMGPYKDGKQAFAFIIWSSYATITVDDFEICSFRFKINDLNAGEQQIKFYCANASSSEAMVNITLKTTTPGDVNNDGSITAADARLALRASVELEKLSETQTLAADVDKNKTVTAADARMILRASVGLEKLS